MMSHTALIARLVVHKTDASNISQSIYPFGLITIVVANVRCAAHGPSFGYIR